MDDVAPGSIGLLSAVEVLEHCVNPRLEVGELFAKQPDVLFTTTVTYEGQGPDWYYLGLQTGQHIFFYSRAGLRMLAETHGYHYFGSSYFHIFTRHAIPAYKRAILSALMSSPGIRAMRIWLAASLRGTYFQTDSEFLSRRINSTSNRSS
jgi:hypothetical protein